MSDALNKIVVDETVGGSDYAAFLDGMRGEPSADACLAWAREHAGDPDAGRAILDAGWCRVNEGRADESLELFGRVRELGGAVGRNAQVGFVEALYGLDRDAEAEQVLGSLRSELEERPEGVADLVVINDLGNALGDRDLHEAALEWCEFGIARAAELGDTEEVRNLRHLLAIGRAYEREAVGLEPDDADEVALAEADAALAEFGDIFRDGEFSTDVLEELDRRQRIMDEGAYDGVVLRWGREEFPVIRARWPESTTRYGDEYDDYALRVEQEARSLSRTGAHKIHLVTGILAEYETYAEREGRDPEKPSTFRDYGPWALQKRPDTVPAWPPGRNAPCWCDSGRKYKKCCGHPARHVDA